MLFEIKINKLNVFFIYCLYFLLSHDQVMIWKMKKPYEIFHRLSGHQNDVVSCDFSPDGVLLATASYDTRVIIWDIHEGQALRELGYVVIFFAFIYFFMSSIFIFCIFSQAILLLLG